MTERTRRLNLRRWRPRGLAWSTVLIAALAVAVAAEGSMDDQLELASRDHSRVSEVRAALAALPARPLVLVGMDGDLGTYPEIRPAVQALLRELFEADARVAIVSFTPEGRAIAAAEAAQLRELGIGDERLLEIGFVAGAEAGLVLAVTDLVPAGSSNPLAQAISVAGDGIAVFDMAVVVGGIDFGPRSWVEQVGTRVPALPMIGVAPTFAYPELAPYLRTGQLAALLGTVRDDAAYSGSVRDRLGPSPGGDLPSGPGAMAMLLGMLVALAIMGRSLVVRGRQAVDDELEPEDGG